MPSSLRHLASLFAAGLLATTAANAALPPVSAGERVVFSDDFDDNRYEWSSVAVINKTGAPASTQAAIIDSQWTASLGDSVAITSTVTLKPSLHLKNGPVSIYFFAQVAEPSGTDGNRFGVTLSEPSPARGFARLVVRPANNGFIEFRNETDASRSVPGSSTRPVFHEGPAARAFKLTITPSPDDGGPATAEAFYHDAKTKTYVSLALAQNLVWLKSGELATLSLSFRNGGDGPVWIDSVVVTQTKSPR